MFSERTEEIISSIFKSLIFFSVRHVDLLIGIDHAHMHAGETRQVDHLLARKSPFGWVVFGRKPEQICGVTSVLHAKHALPIDLLN